MMGHGKESGKVKVKVKVIDGQIRKSWVNTKRCIDGWLDMAKLRRLR